MYIKVKFKKRPLFYFFCACQRTGAVHWGKQKVRADLPVSCRKESWIPWLSKQRVSWCYKYLCFASCKDALRSSAEIRQTSSGSTSRKCHWLLVLGQRTSLWAKIEAVGDLARVVLSLFCCIACFHSWWDLGLPSNVLVKNLGLEASFAPRWDVCGVRAPSCPYLPWEGRLVLGILSRLVVAWASVTTNCLQDLETRCYESRIQLLHAAGGQSPLGSSQQWWVQLSFPKEDFQKAEEQPIPSCCVGRSEVSAGAPRDRAGTVSELSGQQGRSVRALLGCSRTMTVTPPAAQGHEEWKEGCSGDGNSKTFPEAA